MHSNTELTVACIDAHNPLNGRFFVLILVLDIDFEKPCAYPVKSAHETEILNVT